MEGEQTLPVDRGVYGDKGAAGGGAIGEIDGVGETVLMGKQMFTSSVVEVESVSWMVCRRKGGSSAVQR
jgi:hypothetical protein